MLREAANFGGLPRDVPWQVTRGHVGHVRRKAATEGPRSRARHRGRGATAGQELLLLKIARSPITRQAERSVLLQILSRLPLQHGVERSEPLITAEE